MYPLRSLPCSRNWVRSTRTGSPTCAPIWTRSPTRGLGEAAGTHLPRSSWSAPARPSQAREVSTNSPNGATGPTQQSWRPSGSAAISSDGGAHPHGQRSAARSNTSTADALDRAVGAYLTDRLHTQTNDTAPKRPRRIIAVNGKALQGSARLDQARRHLLSALDHAGPVTIAGAEVGSKTNETRHCKPLLSPLDLAGAVITFDALHSAQDHVQWLVN